jgi:hypothetical protein
MNMKRPIFFLLLSLLTCSILAAQSHHSHFAEQSVFSAEDAAVKKPVTIPEDVQAILAKDEMVNHALENENLPAEKLPLTWFSASAIHLSKPSQKDLVVMAVGPLAGGNVVTFWIFRRTTHGHELVLMAPAHDLIVKSSRWKEYRDIELTSMSAVTVSTVLCRFDGRRYTGYKSKTENIR